MTNTSLTSRPGNGLARSEIPLADLIHVSEKEEPPSSGFQACSNGQTISPSLPSTSLNFQFPFKPKKFTAFQSPHLPKISIRTSGQEPQLNNGMTGSGS
jgi:hypothetical protein